MIVDSHRLGAGEKAAEIAAVLTERGLGGDSVDLDARLDQFRRDRSQRAAARAVSRSAGPRRSLGEAAATSVSAPRRREAEPSTGVMLAFAFPDRVARNRGNGSFVLANGRGAAVDQTSALARAPYIAVGRIDRHGGAAAASCWRRRSRRRRSSSASPIRSRPPTRFRSIAARWRCGRGARKHCTPSRLSEAPLALSPSEETARVLADGLIAAGLDKLPWSKPQSSGATA